MRLLPLLCLAVATFTLTAAPSESEACSAPICWPGTLTPTDGAMVPASVPGIYWRPLSRNDGGADPADSSNVVLATDAAPSTPLPFTTTPLADGAFLIVPSDPLLEGTTYFVTDGNACNSYSMGPKTSFSVTSATPEPTALGTISVTEEAVEKITVGTSSGSCSTDVLAHRVWIRPNLVDEASAWNDVFHFDVLVDGQLWQRTESINNLPSTGGTWQLYRTCPSDDTDPGASPGLSKGPHTVVVRATIPGSSTVLMSDEITVDMHCPGESGGDNVDGDDDGEDGGVDEDGGCQATSSTTMPWLLLALLGLVIRRRQPRNSSSIGTS